ncbi:glucosamine-6-phosphate deaminase [Mucilaginibacter pallidiroseus]|uniref:Glucosamine-6-phosphate deaminase n=1 Tax=Mucilaginibacter pallidiroseus TaxID=2599295 RepID=A0A563UCG6_9SPHI|nr:glucosamine-6-phosphate deaminase [Mucilaginibacter pallidiroseus]TWR28973.1 glucosamine-6-phosphate deaminase [Mucilaginibacter pallidiroseus]
MQVKVFSDYDAMSKAVADMVAKQLAEKPDSLICFPSGDSPTGMLKHLVDAANNGDVDLSKCAFVGLDEWVGMDENDFGSCKYYLKHNLFDKLLTQPKEVTLFDAKAPDLEAECKRINKYIAAKGGLDMMIVGIGMNGHLGLNEPGTPFDLYAHPAELAPITIEVGQKYFKSETKLTGGITLGLRHLAESKIPVLIASGEKKAGIIAQSLEGEVCKDVPASILQTLQHAVILLDEPAASGLTKE